MAGQDHLTRVAATGTGELLLYGLTPPPRDQIAAKIARTVHRARERRNRIRPDATIVYDLVDEPGHSGRPRPFPFTPTQPPVDYVRTHLRGTDGAVVLYRNAGAHTEDELRAWLSELEEGTPIVLVGAVSDDVEMATSLPRAQEIARAERPDAPLGGITIAERHALHGDEHERLLRKQESGCSFFVSQVVYDADPAVRLLQDYAPAVIRAGMRPAPIVFALSLCGSAKQLDLLEWLGVAVPDDIAEELRHGPDPRGESTRHCLEVARRLTATCRGLGLPFGFAVESVSDLRADADAAVELAREVGALLRR